VRGREEERERGRHGERGRGGEGERERGREDERKRGGEGKRERERKGHTHTSSTNTQNNQAREVYSDTPVFLCIIFMCVIFVFVSLYFVLLHLCMSDTPVLCIILHSYECIHMSGMPRTNKRVMSHTCVTPLESRYNISESACMRHI